MKKILTLFKVATSGATATSNKSNIWITNLILFFCISAGISLTIAYYAEGKIEEINNNIVEINNTKDNLTDSLLWTNLQRFKTLVPEIQLIDHKTTHGEEYAEYLGLTHMLSSSYGRLHFAVIDSYGFLNDNYPEVLKKSNINHNDYDDSIKQYEDFFSAETYDEIAFEKFVAENKQALVTRYRVLQSSITNYIESLDDRHDQSKIEIQTMMAFTTKLLIVAFVIQIIIYILWQYVEFSFFRDD